MKYRVLMLLVLFSVAMVCVSPVFATNIEHVRFYGTITDSNGFGIEGVNVKIMKGTDYIGQNETDSNGYYEIPCYDHISNRNGTYQMYINGNKVDEQYIDQWVYDGGWNCWSVSWSYWSHIWNHQLIPEFATIAIPAAMVLGLVFLIQRKRK